MLRAPGVAGPSRRTCNRRPDIRLPLAMRGRGARFRSGYDTATGASRPASRQFAVEDVSSEAAERDRIELPGDDGSAGLAGFALRSITVSTLRDGSPDLSFIGRRAISPPAARWGGPRVERPPIPARPLSRRPGQSGHKAGSDSSWYSPNGSSRQPQVVAHQHAQSRVGRRRRVARRRHAFYGQSRRTVVQIGSTAEGGAREAAREHVPPRQHRW
jgi:hypothetical protein